MWGWSLLGVGLELAGCGGLELAGCGVGACWVS